MDRNESYDFEADLVSLVDDEGNEFEFQVLDEIDFEGEHYLALMPLFELPDGDAEETYMIFRSVEDGDEPQLVEVDDDDLLDRLAEIFEAHFDDIESDLGLDDIDDDDLSDIE